MRLDVLLGPADFLDQMMIDDEGNDGGRLDQLKHRFGVSSLQKVRVPAYPANSEEEWKKFNNLWPTSYFPNQTEEFREQKLKLTDKDVELMRQGMEEALMDAAKQLGDSNVTAVGTVIVAPETGVVLARSTSEMALQAIVGKNPLATSVISAIQAVSRKERQAATEHGMNSQSFRAGQYLCTGLDVYTTREPTVFEAMALVHSRIRHLVYGCSSSSSSGDGHLGGISEAFVHALPGTNHKYRSFKCDLNKLCSGV